MGAAGVRLSAAEGSGGRDRRGVRRRGSAPTVNDRSIPREEEIDRFSEDSSVNPPSEQPIESESGSGARGRQAARGPGEDRREGGDVVSTERARAEAVALVTGTGVEPHERARLHRRILERRTRRGGRVGIAGGKVCQACGALEAFAGLAGARLKHHHGDFLCSLCLRELSGTSAGTYGSAELGRVEEEMSRRPLRFCEVCRGEVAPGAATRVGLFTLVCGECHSELENIDGDVEGLLYSLSRLRYLEFRHPAVASLREYDRFNDWQRAELDAGWGSG